MWLATWARSQFRITELASPLWINRHPNPRVLSLRWYVIYLQTSIWETVTIRIRLMTTSTAEKPGNVKKLHYSKILKKKNFNLILGIWTFKWNSIMSMLSFLMGKNISYNHKAILYRSDGKHHHLIQFHNEIHMRLTQSSLWGLILNDMMQLTCTCSTLLPFISFHILHYLKWKFWISCISSMLFLSKG